MSEKITFKELVEKISETTSQSEQRTDSFIHELVEIIESGLEQGEKITISGFGKFELRWMNERKGRNPQTGEELTIPGQNKVVFKPYKALREHVNLPFKTLSAQVLEESAEDHPEKEDKSETIAAVPSSAGTRESVLTDADDDDEDIDDLITERPSPVKSKIPTFEDESDEEVAAVFNDLDSENADIPEIDNIDREEKARAVQAESKFNWSYTAASIVVLLAIFLIIFLLARQGDAPGTADRPLADQPEQIETPATLSPAPAATVGEPESTPQAESEPEGAASTEHAISDGESFWTIADQTYGNPYLWPLIYLENIQQVENPNLITSGGVLTVPHLSDPENLSQRESDEVAKGYLAVYDWMRADRPESARYFLWAAGSFSQDQLRQASERVNESDLAFAIQQ